MASAHSRMDSIMPTLNMPNFLLIGAPKSGTTSLFQYLRMHPDIFLSSLKEPNFFAFEGQNITYNGPGDQRGNRCRIHQLDAYQNLFSQTGESHALGEASTVYLYSETAAANIARHVPKMKLIAILRNPVDLAYSAYLHMRREGREPCQTFEEALAQEETRIKEGWTPLWHLTAQGAYAKQLKRYYQHFPKAQVKTFFYEEWQSNSQKVLKDILTFLEVDNDVKLDTSKRFNESGKPKNIWLHHLLTKNNPLKQWLKPLLPKKFRRGMMASFTKSNLAQSQDPKMLDSTRKILQEHFHDDIKELENLTGQNLSHWLNHE